MKNIMTKRKSKKLKNYKIAGYGFPVILDEVELEDVLGDGDWVPRINEIKLNLAVFETLAFTPIKLMGAHVVFIRKFLNMNQEKFASELGLSRHGAVSKWEQKGLELAGMKPATEILIRVLMREKLGHHQFPIAEIKALAMLEETGKAPEPLRLKHVA